MNHSLISAAWSMLESVTPLAHDCGGYCGHACCLPDEDGQGGVFLFPGEDMLLQGVDWARIEPASPNALAPMLVCEGRCERARRPLGCRIFPLTPVVNGEGLVTVRLDRRAWAVCPLMPHGLRGLQGTFVEAVQGALSLVAQDPEGLAFLRAWQALEECYARL